MGVLFLFSGGVCYIDEFVDIDVFRHAFEEPADKLA